jgi:hypothetical protein
VNVVEKPQDIEKNMEHWTSVEKETCKSRYGCEILVENGSYTDVCTKEAPRDAYIVKYTVDGEMCFDLTRGSRSKLFDMYWDKFRENLKNIDFGYGTINPKTWGYQAPKTKKRK